MTDHSFGFSDLNENPELSDALEMHPLWWQGYGEAMISDEKLSEVAAELNNCPYLEPVITPVRAFTLVGLMQLAYQSLDPDSYSGTVAREMAEHIIAQFQVKGGAATAAVLESGWGQRVEPLAISAAEAPMIHVAHRLTAWAAANANNPVARDICDLIEDWQAVRMDYDRDVGSRQDDPARLLIQEASRHAAAGAAVTPEATSRVLTAHVLAIEWLSEVVANATRGRIVLVRDGVDYEVTPEGLIATAYKVGVQNAKDLSAEAIAEACVRALRASVNPPDES